MFYLDFEEKLEKLDTEKRSLLKLSEENGLDVSNKISAIEEKEKNELHKIYSNLSPWQIVKIARHPNRPKTKDYISNIFTDFTSLLGDRLYSEDSAIISGSESPIKVITCDIIPLKDGFEVKATLENISSFNENTFGVIEYPEKPNSWICQKTSLVSGNQLEVIATLYLDGTYFVDRSNLNLTVFS